jgi:hypothetical protein
VAPPRTKAIIATIPKATTATTTPASSTTTAQDALPPGYQRFTPASTQENIDPQTEWTRAHALALKRFPDARVSELYASHVRLDGTVDLTTGGIVSADFGSTSAFDAAEPAWGLKVALMASGGFASELDGGTTTSVERLAPWPRCTVREIMHRAANGLPAGGVALVQYIHDAFKVRWLVRMGSVDLEFADDCHK